MVMGRTFRIPPGGSGTPEVLSEIPVILRSSVVPTALIAGGGGGGVLPIGSRGRELCGLGLSSLDLAVAACVGTVSSCNVLPEHDTCTVVDCPPGCVALAGLCL